jgi:murein DD-endopeptidase MepM/ murein hydrolase activator NlpD
MSVKDIQTKATEKFDPSTEAGLDLYKPKNPEQEEIDKLEGMRAGRSVTKRERRRNQPRRWQLATKRLRGKSSLIAVALVLFGGGGAMTIFSSPMLAIVQLKEVLTQDLNDQLKSFDNRSAKMMRAKLKTATNGSCGAVKIACKFATMTDAQVKQFEKSGIKVNRDPPKGLLKKRGQVTSMEFTNPNGGEKVTIDSPERFADLSLNDMDFRAAMSKSYNPLFASLTDSVAKAKYRFFKTGPSPKLTGSTDEEMNKQANEAIANGVEDPAVNTIHEQVDKDGNKTGTYVDDKGNPVAPEEVNAANETSKITAEAEKVGTTNVISSLGKGIAITGAADNACTTVGALRKTGQLAKGTMTAQAVRMAVTEVLEPADQIKAGEGTPELANHIGDKINNIGGPIEPETIPDESKLYDANTAVNPPETPNPNRLKNAFDGAGLRVSLYGDVSKLSTREARFSLGGGFVGTMAKINQLLAKIINGGNPDPRAIARKCKLIQNNLVRGASGALGIAAGIGSFGLTTALGVAASLGVSMALPWVLSHIADIGAGHVFQNLWGMDFGDGGFVGSSGLFGAMAMQRGMKPLSSEEAVAYTNENKQVNDEYAAVERYKAQSTPFDVNNQFSFLGSLSRTVAPFVRSSNTSVGTMAFSIANLVPASLSLATQTTKADNTIQRFQQCDDPMYRELNIGADIFCNVRYGLSDKDMSLDPIENANWMAQTGNIDPESETGDAKDNGQDWNYEKFLKECVNRKEGWGEEQDENEGDGSNCLSPENEPLNMHFRIYTMDKSVSDAMDLEDGDGQLPGTSAYDNGQKGPVSADGWAYPTTPELGITNGYNPADNHKGIDISITPGSQAFNKPLFAARDGVVSAAGPADGFGNWIVITSNIDGQRYDLVYGHMFDDGVMVKLGDTVRAGQQIGKVGYNGSVVPPGVDGAHLHFEIRKGSVFDGVDNSIDPTPIVEKARGAK